MNLIVFLTLLLLAGFSFFALYTDKWPILRRLAWFLFFLSTAFIIKLWLQFFFIDMACNGELLSFSLKLTIGGKICLACFAVLVFFLWVYLIHRQDEMSLSRIAKDVSKFFIAIAVTIISLISLFSVLAH